MSNTRKDQQRKDEVEKASSFASFPSQTQQHQEEQLQSSIRQ
jgi:hypothetical protein